MTRRARQVTTVGVLVWAVLLANPAVPGAQAVSKVQGASSLHFTAPQTAPAAVLGAVCVEGKLSYDRHEGCSIAPGELVVTNSRGGRIGSMKVRVTQRTVLAARDSRTWTHRVTLHPTFADGAARSASVKVTMGCGSGAKACRVDKGPAARTLTVGQDSVFDFALSSPGSDTLTHKEQPFVALTPSGGPPTTGTLPQLGTVRCDSVKGITTAKGGCVHPATVPVFSLSRTDPLVREAAEHVFDAQEQLAGHPGRQGDGKPLHRTTDKSVIAKNRGAACPQSLERPAGKSCDEYPFASTKEGGASGIYSRRMINADQNSTAGGSNYLLKAYKDHRILDGDAFWVAVA